MMTTALRTVLLFSASLLFFPSANTQNVPEGFFDAPFVEGLDYPLGITFDETGRMYLWEKSGIVWVYDQQGNRLPEPLIDLRERTAHYAEHGLNYFLLDKDYLSNGRVYLYHVIDLHWYYNFGTADYDPAFDVTTEATIGRLSSFVVGDPSGLSPRADLNSENILVGETLSTGIPILMTSHGIGSVQQAEDGTLLLSNGDGASFLGTDVGSDSLQSRISSALEHGIIEPHQDVGSYKSQYRNVLNGKILRIDPDTGDGVPSNPFYIPGQPRHPASRIWAYGFRNPYRMVIKPFSGAHAPEEANPGLIVTGDVGAAAWEEINVMPRGQGGLNFGWPVYEGNRNHWGFNNYPDIPNQFAPNPLYGQGDCDREFFGFKELVKNANPERSNYRTNRCDNTVNISYEDGFTFATPPTLFWNNRNFNPGDLAAVAVWNENGGFGYMDRMSITAPGSPIEGENFTGEASLGGVFYTSDTYPEEYRDAYFHMDYAGWIKAFYFDDNDQLYKVESFADGLDKPNHLALNPADGNLYYISLEADQVRSISFGGNPPPVAEVVQEQFFGGPELTVQFDASPSYDPNDSPLSYHWDFGDGTEGTGIAPQHTFATSLASPQNYLVTLTVTDEEGASGQKELLVSLNNSAPAAEITSIREGDRYPIYQSTLLDLEANISDTESNLEELEIEWQVFLHHNTHYHPETPTQGKSSYIILTPAGCSDEGDYWYRVRLTVTDPQGLKTVTEREIFPACGPEPIDWSTLSGFSEEEIIQLDVRTFLTSEVARLELQRSADFYNFTTLEIFAPNAEQSYPTTDPNPLSGVAYYRLKARMADGSLHFSDPEPIAFNPEAGHLLSPNPVDDQLRIDIYNPRTESARLSFFSISGQQLFRSVLELAPGIPNERFLEIGHLPTGIYLYRIEEGDSVYQGKVLVR